ncbi:histidinol-phosphatase HisJ family protein [Acetitomaculum ruminis]
MLSDYHLHSDFSADSQEKPENQILQGIKLGLKHMCFTDHVDYDYPLDEIFEFDMEEYFNTLNALKEKYKDQIEVHIGVELGLQPHLQERYDRLLSSYPFDFVIGSSHVVKGFDPYYGEYYEGRTEYEAYHEYFEYVLENIMAFDNFDVYGHIDYVVRYGPNKNADYSYEKYSDIIDRILQKLIEKGKGIELNTAGFKYGLGHPNPTEKIIEKYRELGGKIITIGSDGHKTEHLGYDFEKVPNILKTSGFNYYNVFKNRKIETILLDS